MFRQYLIFVLSVKRRFLPVSLPLNLSFLLVHDKSVKGGLKEPADFLAMDFPNEFKKMNQKYLRLRPVPSIRMGQRRILFKIFIDRF